MQSGSFKSILLATAIAASPVMAAGAHARSAAAQVYNIPSQPLGDALVQLAQASGRNILFKAAVVDGKTSAPVRDAHDFESALRALIAGDEVEYTIDADGAATIHPARARRPRQSKAVPTAAGADSGPGAGPSEVASLVVTGERLSPSVEAQMQSNTPINVLSADDLASKPDRNVAEALARLPGVNVMFATQSQVGPQGNGQNYGGLDTAARAEGQFVSLRAMNGEYNVNLINGIDVAQGMPYSREVELSLLPPIGLNDIVVSKASTADMEGDAIGGTVDFRMPTAFETPGPHFSMYASGRDEDRGAQYGLDHMGYTVQLSGSNTFGSNGQFGIYASGYYEDRHFANSEQSYQSGEVEYQVVNAQKQVPTGMNPDDDLQLMSVNMQMAVGETQRYGYVSSLDWNVNNDVHAFFRGTYARSTTDETVYQLGVQGDRTDNGGFAKGEPLDGTGGADGLMRVVSTQTELHQWVESNPSLDTLGTLDLGVTGKFGRLTVTPQAYYSWGENDFPDHFEVTFYKRGNDPTGNDANPAFQRFNTGLALAYNNNYPIPIFTAAEKANIAQVGNWPVNNGGEVTDGRSGQKKEGAKIDLDYDVDNGWLKSIKFGAKYTTADRRTTFRDVETNAALPTGSTLNNSGMVYATINSIIPGVYNYALPLLSPQAFWNAYTRNGGFNVTWTPDNYNGDTVKGSEDVASAYVLADLQYGNLEITPGLRFEHTDIHDIFWISGNNGVDLNGVHYGWSSSDSHFDEVLPSIFATWRPQPNAVYRASVWTSYTKPPFIELAGDTQTQVDSDGNVHITKGNPDLKAIDAVNFDASGAWTTNFGTYASVAGYFKELSHYIYNGGGNFSTVNSQTGAQTTVSQPLNGGSAHVYGLELDLREKFIMLPGPYAGLGVAANATLQQSEAHLNNPLLSSNERMQNAPDTLLNLSLLYEKYGFSGDLSFHYSGDYISNYGLWGTTSFGSPFNSSALDQWVHAHQQLDLNLAYTFPQGLQMRFGVENLTDTVTYYDTIGRHSDAAPEIVEGGRTYLLSARYAF